MIRVTSADAVDDAGTGELQEPPAFTSRAGQSSQPHRAGQAFQSLSFDGERSIVNKHWAKKRRSHLLNPYCITD